MEANYHDIIDSALSNEDSHTFLKLISSCIESIKTRRLIIESLIDVYCQYYIDNNMWPTQKIRDKLAILENTKVKDPESTKVLMSIFTIITKLKRRNYNFSHYSLEECEKNDLLYLFDIEYKNLAELKEILKPTPYGLLNIMQTHIINGDFDTIRRLLTHILSLKPKDLTLDNYDSIDIISLFIESIYTSHPPLLKDDMYHFWLCCKDILYYQPSKKKKLNRVNTLYMMLYTVCKNNLKNKRLLEDKEEKLINSSPSQCDPLFIIFNYDYQAMAEVQNIKARRHQIEDPKIIKLQDCPLLNDGIPRKDSVEIIKS